MNQALKWWHNLSDEDSIKVMKSEGIYGHDQGVTESEIEKFFNERWIKWDAFKPGGAPEDGEEVLALHKNKEEPMKYDAKYAAFNPVSRHMGKQVYMLGIKHQEYITHWKRYE